MIKTRRFKAVDTFVKGENPSIVDKIAIYDENGKQTDCCIIFTDYHGREYYYPSNPHDKFGLFVDKIKDAIECIRNGYGDAIMGTDSVVRFIDREYGEGLRQKTLDGWKNAKFAYGVKFSYLNTFNGGKLVTVDKTVMSYDQNLTHVLSFDNEKDAFEFIKEVNTKAYKYYKEYMSLKRTGDDDYDFEHIVRPFFNSIEGKVENGPLSIYWQVFYGLCEEKKSGDCQYKFEPVQIVKVN